MATGERNFPSWTRLPTQARLLLGAHLRKKIVEKNKSNQEIAHLVGVQPPAVSKWLNGGSSMRHSNFLKLANVLQCSPWELIPESWHTLEPEQWGSPPKFAVASTRLHNPFIRLEAYDEANRERFFGRRAEVKQTISAVDHARAWMLVGESGVGKTSLIQAGVIPALKDMYPVAQVLPNPGFRNSLPGRIAEQWQVAKKKAIFEVLGSVSRGIVVLDQVERFFSPEFPKEDRNWLFETVLRSSWEDMPNVRWLLVMRADQLHHLYDHPVMRGRLFQQSQRLYRLSFAAAQEALSSTFALLSDITVESDLIEQLVKDLATSAGWESDRNPYPPYLQLVGYELVEHARRENQAHIRREHYDELGGAEGVVQRYFRSIFSAFPHGERDLLSQLLIRLCPQGRRTQLTTAELEDGPWDRFHAEQVLSALKDGRIVRFDEEHLYYELVHDILARQVFSQLRERDPHMSFSDLLAISENPPAKPSSLLIRNLISSSARQDFPLDVWEQWIDTESELLRTYWDILDHSSPQEAVRILARLRNYGNEHGIESNQLLEEERAARFAFREGPVVCKATIELLADRGLPNTLVTAAVEAFRQENDPELLQGWIEVLGRCSAAPFLELIDCADTASLDALPDSALQLYVLGLLSPELPWHRERSLVKQKIMELAQHRSKTFPALATVAKFKDPEWLPLVLELLNDTLLTQHEEWVYFTPDLFNYLYNISPNNLFSALLRYVRWSTNDDEERVESVVPFLAHCIEDRAYLTQVLLLHCVAPQTRRVVEAALYGADISISNATAVLHEVEQRWPVTIAEELRPWLMLHDAGCRETWFAAIDAWDGKMLPAPFEGLPMAVLTGIAQRVADAEDLSPDITSVRLHRLYQLGRLMLCRKVAAFDIPNEHTSTILRCDPCDEEHSMERQLLMLLGSLPEPDVGLKAVDDALQGYLRALREHGEVGTLAVLEVALMASGPVHDMWHAVAGEHISWADEYEPARIALAQKSSVPTVRDAQVALQEALERLECANAKQKVGELSMILDRLAFHFLGLHMSYKVPGGYDRVYPFISRPFPWPQLGFDFGGTVCLALSMQDSERARQDLENIVRVSDVDPAIVAAAKLYMIRVVDDKNLLPWMMCVGPSNPRLIEALESRVRRGMLPPSIVDELLRSGEKDRVLFGLKVISRLGIQRLRPIAQRLLTHTDETVRIAAKETLCALVRNIGAIAG